MDVHSAHLIVATWNHLGDMGYATNGLHALDQWGRAKHYFWHSGGYAPTQTGQSQTGRRWVNCLFLREMGGGKPFMLGNTNDPPAQQHLPRPGDAVSGMGLTCRSTIRRLRRALQMLRFRANTPRCTRRSCPMPTSAGLPREASKPEPRGGRGVPRPGRALSERQIVFEVGVDGRLDPALACPQPALLVPAPRRPDEDCEPDSPLGTATHAPLARTNNLPHWVEATQSNGSGASRPLDSRHGLGERGAACSTSSTTNPDEEAAAALPKNRGRMPASRTNLTCRVGSPRRRVSRIRFHTPEQRRPGVALHPRSRAVAFQVPSFPFYGVVEKTVIFADD